MSPGRYSLEREIGRGEMGVVHLARDPRLERQLAVKILSLPSGLSDVEKQEYRLRFLREAKAAAALSHPGIVAVHDAGDEDGALFIAMEFVQGETLRQRVARLGQLDPAEAVSIAASIAEALHAAHEKGIVHRDIKPANILLRDEDGATKIADFGVACLPGSELTRRGTSLGSPAYMSPEQIEGAAALPASDLFSLAVILYECLSGKRPFAGESLPALARAITHGRPSPLGHHLGKCPPALEAFFDKALAKKPSDRFGSGLEFSRALRNAFANGKRAPVPSTSRLGRAIEIAALGVLLLIGAVLAIQGIHDVARGGSYTAIPKAAASTKSPDLAATPGAREVPGPHAARKDSPISKSSLVLSVKHRGSSGTMVVLVDGDTVYTRRLSEPEKSGFPFVKKSERFEARINVASGRHLITARVRPVGKDKYEDSIRLDLKPGQTRTLEVVLGRTLGRPMSLKAD